MQITSGRGVTKSTGSVQITGGRGVTVSIDDERRRRNALMLRADTDPAPRTIAPNDGAAPTRADSELVARVEQAYTNYKESY